MLAAANPWCAAAALGCWTARSAARSWSCQSERSASCVRACRPELASNQREKSSRHQQVDRRGEEQQRTVRGSACGSEGVWGANQTHNRRNDGTEPSPCGAHHSWGVTEISRLPPTPENGWRHFEGCCRRRKRLTTIIELVVLGFTKLHVLWPTGSQLKRGNVNVQTDGVEIVIALLNFKESKIKNDAVNPFHLFPLTVYKNSLWNTVVFFHSSTLLSWHAKNLEKWCQWSESLVKHSALLCGKRWVDNHWCHHNRCIDDNYHDVLDANSQCLSVRIFSVGGEWDLFFTCRLSDKSDRIGHQTKIYPWEYMQNEYTMIEFSRQTQTLGPIFSTFMSVCTP